MISNWLIIFIFVVIGLRVVLPLEVDRSSGVVWGLNKLFSLFLIFLYLPLMIYLIYLSPVSVVFLFLFAVSFIVFTLVRGIDDHRFFNFGLIFLFLMAFSALFKIFKMAELFAILAFIFLVLGFLARLF